MIIHHHLGLGDHFVCNGLVNFIAKNSNSTVDLICKSKNFPTVNCLYSENDNVNIVPIECNDSNEVSKVNDYAILKNKQILRIGFEHCSANDWDKSFYKQVGINFIERYRFFKLPRLLIQPILEIPNYDYVFVHNESSDGILNIDIRSNLPKKYVNKQDTNNLLSYIDLIKYAKEIHCINSSLFHLIDSISCVTNNLYYHDIRKHPCNFEISTKWNIIKYV